MNYQRLNVILGWLLGIVATGVYVATLEPTASFWDCGEYIATSNKLEVGHPPGAPTFMMIGRLFTIAADPENVAWWINFISALSSGLTITFLFWTITALGKRLATIGDNAINEAKEYGILGAGIVGALAFTFSDTFWFSAVEGEVYAMSSLFTAIVFWAMLKWEQEAHDPYSNKWLVLITYLIGLSIGIHLLNLLTIPALAFIYYFKRYKKHTLPGIVITGAIGVVLLGAIQNLIIPLVVKMATWFELFFTNGLSLPFNTGSIIYALIIIGGITFGLIYTHKRNLVTLNTIILSFSVLLIGYSSFGMILIRSSANTPIDENNPENTIGLLSYLNREQYGDFPLLYGQFFNTPQDVSTPREDGDPVYYRDYESGTYRISDDRKGAIPVYADEFSGLFPRMYSPKANHVRAYKKWSDYVGKAPKNYNGQPIRKVKSGENLKYFFDYQIGWMYFRYFMWNFAGRQNDVQGHGNITDGNWLSGIGFLDESRLGNQSNLPIDMATNKARNTFYLLPFLLGLFGLFYQLWKDPKYTLVVFLLFFFTGLAIVVYLNQYPYQPRERDYAYVGSFYAFAIWIGLGALGLIESLSNALNPRISAALGTVVCTLAVPAIMASEGWDDHDRSGRYTARDIAKDYLDSCDKNAILFTNGDNDTFPLWYVQEVEGYRTDVRIVNLTLLSTDWFINQMRRAAYDGKPIPMTIDDWQYRQGTRDYVHIIAPKEAAKNKAGDLGQLVTYITSDDKMTTKYFQDKVARNVLPTRKFRLPVNKQEVLENGTVKPERAGEIVPYLEWSITGNILMKSEIVVMDILSANNWKRPIYFANTMTRDSYFGLEQYMQHEGFAYRLVPVKARNRTTSFGAYGDVETDIMYERLVNKFTWGGLDVKEDLTITVGEGQNTMAVATQYLVAPDQIRSQNNLAADAELQSGQTLQIKAPVDIYMDENNLRFVTNLRLSFTRLAEALIQKGEKDRAKIVLDKCWDISINENMPFDIPVLRMADLYYQLEEWDRANLLVYRLADQYQSTMEFVFSLEGENQLKVGKSQIDQAMGVLRQLSILAKNPSNTDQEIGQRIDNYVNTVLPDYGQMQQNNRRAPATPQRKLPVPKG